MMLRTVIVTSDSLLTKLSYHQTFVVIKAPGVSEIKVYLLEDIEMEPCYVTKASLGNCPSSNKSHWRLDPPISEELGAFVYTQVCL
jgi:hypothetical protein